STIISTFNVISSRGRRSGSSEPRRRTDAECSRGSVIAHPASGSLCLTRVNLTTPLWGIVPFRHMIEARSVDIVMIDQVRSGGITPWLKIAGMAEAFNIPVVSHGVPEIHVHLVGAVPNGLTVEYMPRLFPLWRAVPQPVDGMLEMPAAPGLGLEFDDSAIEKYRAGRTDTGQTIGENDAR